MGNIVFSIGHSVHPIETFMSLLAMHKIEAIADVRSGPYSRYTPQFNREPLKERLKSAGIAYVFLGKELGARSEDRDCYIDGKVQYDLLARTQLFQSGISRIVDGAGSQRIALMCAEKDPLTCHRTILVCRHLVDLGLSIKHILDDGRIEGHDEALGRLLRELSMPDNDLFRSRSELSAEAYSKRGRQIAYSEKQESVAQSETGIQQ